VTCREFADFLNAWMDGDLLAAEAARFEQHLRVCRACTRYLASYRTTQELCGALAARHESRAPDAVPEALVLAILASRAPRLPGVHALAMPDGSP